MDRSFTAKAISKIIAFQNVSKPGKAKAWLLALHKEINADAILAAHIEINDKDKDILETRGVTA